MADILALKKEYCPASELNAQEKAFCEGYVDQCVAQSAQKSQGESTYEVVSESGTKVGDMDYYGCLGFSAFAGVSYKKPKGAGSNIASDNTAPAEKPKAPEKEALDLSFPEVERQVLVLVNKERVAAGLPPLEMEPRLQQCANGHSEEMFRLNYFDHESPVAGNRTLPDRLANAGMTKYGWAGENIAMTYNPSAENLVDMWMKSPGHRENLMRPEFRYTGISVYGVGDIFYATQVFSSGK